MTTATHTPVRINPTSWNVPLGFDQAQLRSTPERLLTLAGQGPVDESGALLHEGDVGRTARVGDGERRGPAGPGRHGPARRAVG